MPPVRAISVNNSDLTVIDRAGTKALSAAAIPADRDDVAKAEAWIDAWLLTNVATYQARAHVFSLRPFSWTIGTWNQGEKIPAGWWLEQ